MNIKELSMWLLIMTLLGFLIWLGSMSGKRDAGCERMIINSTSAHHCCCCQ